MLALRNDGQAGFPCRCARIISPGRSRRGAEISGVQGARRQHYREGPHGGDPRPGPRDAFEGLVPATALLPDQRDRQALRHGDYWGIAFQLWWTCSTTAAPRPSARTSATSPAGKPPCPLISVTMGGTGREQAALTRKAIEQVARDLERLLCRRRRLTLDCKPRPRLAPPARAIMPTGALPNAAPPGRTQQIQSILALIAEPGCVVNAAVPAAFLLDYMKARSDFAITIIDYSLYHSLVTGDQTMTYLVPGDPFLRITRKPIWGSWKRAGTDCVTRGGAGTTRKFELEQTAGLKELGAQPPLFCALRWAAAVALGRVIRRRCPGADLWRQRHSSPGSGKVTCQVGLSRSATSPEHGSLAAIGIPA